MKNEKKAIRNYIIEKTGMAPPPIYDNGNHYVTNQTLEMLEEISDFENVLEVTGDYTGRVDGGSFTWTWGAQIHTIHTCVKCHIYFMSNLHILTTAKQTSESNILNTISDNKTLALQGYWYCRRREWWWGWPS